MAQDRHLELRLRGHGGRPRLAIEESQLTEVLPRAEGVHGLPIHAHTRSAFEDHVEAIPHITLAGQLDLGLQPHRLDVSRDRLQLGPAAVGEQVNGPEHLDQLTPGSHRHEPYWGDA